MPNLNVEIPPSRKDEVLRQITSLVKEVGPIEAKDIVVALAPDDISPRIINNYLDELEFCGYLNRVCLNGKRRNVRAYKFRSEYGTKTDIVSTALSHPLHQISLRIAGKWA